MDPSLVVSFSEGVSLANNGNGRPAIDFPYGRARLDRLPRAVCDVLDRLAPPGETFGRLSEQVYLEGAAGDVAQLAYWLQHLTARGFVVLSADAAGRRWATLAATCPTFTFGAKELTATPLLVRRDAPYVLSRFAYLRRWGETIVVESPLNAARVVIHEPAVGQLLCALSRPTTVAELTSRQQPSRDRKGAVDSIPSRDREEGADRSLTVAARKELAARKEGTIATDLPPEAAEQVLRLLLAAGMITEHRESGVTVEDERESLQPWEFHDLLFHAQSREGRSGAVLGTTYSFGRRRKPPPVLRPFAFERTIDLRRPDLDALEQTDPPLARVMDQRRSIRQYGPEPMTVEELGEFLYRVGRVRNVFTIGAETPWGHVEMEATSRPYPASGGLYPLEFYAVVQACRGLDAGVYHYDPLGHCLGQVCGRTPDVGHLLDDSAAAIGEPRDTLQVLLVVTARFDRIMWKYAGFGYALILKDLGVVFQNMYLAATAMGLAPCAIGVGNSDRFAHILGCDYYAETSVGEFTLGSVAP